MASKHTSLLYAPGFRLAITVVFLLMQSCAPAPKIYESDCDKEQTFKKVTFAHLLDSLAYYDNRYVETTGIYREGKEQSALYNDSTLIKPDNKALWVNFSQDCDLFLKGTRIGFFEYNNGSFIQINNKKVRIRGKIDVHNHGHLKLYKACLDRISLVEM